MFRFSRFSAYALVLLCAVATMASSQAQEPGAEVKIAFDEKGLSSIIHRGTVLLEPSDARAGLPLWTNPITQSFDQETRILSIEDKGWSYRIQYIVKGNQLACMVRATRKPEGGAALWPLRLRLPRHRDNSERTISEVGGVLLHKTGVIGVVPETPGATVFSEMRYPQRDVTAALTVHPMRGRESRHSIVDNKWFNVVTPRIEVGETRELKFTLAFGPPGATIHELFPGVRERFIQQNPVAFKWEDRRPIGQIFFAHPTRGWATNPRGFNFGRGEKHDVFTEEGLKIFGEELMAYADRNLAILKAMNAQGVIVWNLEGEELYHPVSYLAEPRLLPEAAPEMERFADAFFKKFTDAGLKVGITIRPTEVYDREPGKRRWNHRYVADPVQLMSDKIAYAKKRWGVTIYYIDSNVFANDFGANLPKDNNVPWVMPESMIEALHREHPDVLLIPEWTTSGYYQFSAPYSSPNLGMSGTGNDQRLLYPGAFRAVAINTRMLEQHWEIFVENVQGGDVLMYPTWYNAPENAMVKLIYREAEFRKAQIPAELATASVPVLAEKAKDTVELTRFQVASLLARHTTPEALAATATLLQDPSMVVRRSALIAVRQQKRVASDAVAAHLGEVLTRRDPRDNSLLTSYADALGSLGDAAVPQLVSILEGKQTHSWALAVRALGATGSKDARAEKLLLDILQDKTKAGMREMTAQALGQLGSRAAVPHLINLLDPLNKDESVRRSAVVALGQIGGEAATGALVGEWQRRYLTTVLYAMPRVLDEALIAATGEKWLTGTADWTKWWKAKQTPTG